MKNVLLLFVIFSLPNFLFSQMTVTPDSVQVNVDLNSPFMSVGYATVKNNYDYAITIKWHKGNICNGQGWEYSICDKNQCYFPHTIEKEVELSSGEETNIDMHIDNVSSDFAILNVVITNLSDTSEVKEIRYFFNTTDCLGTPVGLPLIQTDEIKIFPNPVQDELHIFNSSATEVLIFDITGHFIKKEPITNEAIDTHHLKKGTYQIILRNQQKQILATQLFIKI